MNNILESWLKWAFLLISILPIKSTKILHNKRKKNLFPSFTQNGWSRRERDNNLSSHKLIQSCKSVFHPFKKKNSSLKLSKQDKISKENISLNYLNKLMENILHKKYEYKNNLITPIFTIYNLTNYFKHKSLSLENIEFTEQNRNDYTYEKNRIHDFIVEHNLHASKNGQQFEKSDTNVQSNKQQCNGSIKKKNAYCCDDNMNDSHFEDKILCITAKKKIQKSDIICNIPSSYIINFNHIVKQIQKYVDFFSNTYNVNYLKYIFKNNMEEEIKKIDSFTILMYDIYKRHVHFLVFMKSPHIYLKYWDVKLTLIIAYIYFISKYINVLLYAYNFNNTCFVLLNNYFMKQGKIYHTSSENVSQKKEQNIYCINKNPVCNIDEEENVLKVAYTHIRQIHSMLNEKTNDTLKEKTNFFFYKNYEHYVYYITNKIKLSHLPLHFSDSSFFLFNNISMKNIIYFRRQMLHEIINFYKSEDNENSNFLFIDKNVIHRILFTNNEYYGPIEKLLIDNKNSFGEGKPQCSPHILDIHMGDVNRLYHYILLSSEKKSNENQNGVCFHESGSEINKSYGSKNGGNTFSSLIEILDYTIRSIAYNESLFESFDEFFNYNFLMHIYSYVSSHVIKLKSDITVNKEQMDKERRKGENSPQNGTQNSPQNGTQNSPQNGTQNSPQNGTQNGPKNDDCELKDNILSSNIKMENIEKVVEEFSVKECTKHDFNEYEKNEKDENTYMCLIPIIDICNHSNFSVNSIIKKEMRKYAEDKIFFENNLKSFFHSEKRHIKKNEVNDISKDNLPEYMSKKTSYQKEEQMNNNVKDAELIENLDNVQLISSKDIEKDEEITISYGNLSNDLLLLEYGFVDKKGTKVYFYFDIKIVREIIIQILGFDKLPLIMLESLPQVKVNLFKILNVVPNSDNVYERFALNMESAKITRKKKEILNDYLRKNKYFNEYNIFTMKDRINKFYIEEKLQHHHRKNYFYIGSESIVDPVLLATIRIIIYDDLNELTKIKVTDLLKWEYYISPISEAVVLQVLIKLIDEIIYEQFYHMDYEEILKQGKVQYSDLKFLQNKFLQKNLFDSEKFINIYRSNNFKIVIYNVMRLKELQSAKQKLTEKLKHMKTLIRD
ncbi:hypothetical protein, conserved [Plasmodium gonderi]|uniref:SET domain-containing protein n=1 Tax=Plasmodium gonderi TaxID=77519 RepID=A0A1Y1JTM3_PLAGO|nr:hypothetical protein, conserved [Plasmodium gonderi]GAW83254.1 hypothetical protein, conserved [Plasmodium gonderi]